MIVVGYRIYAIKDDDSVQVDTYRDTLKEAAEVANLWNINNGGELWHIIIASFEVDTEEELEEEEE